MFKWLPKFLTKADITCDEPLIIEIRGGFLISGNESIIRVDEIMAVTHYEDDEPQYNSTIYLTDGSEWNFKETYKEMSSLILGYEEALEAHMGKY